MENLAYQVKFYLNLFMMQTVKTHMKTLSTMKSYNDE